MTSPRLTATVAGVCYLVTHVTSVGAVILYGSVLTGHGVIAADAHTRVLAGAFLEVIVAMAIIGTAVALFPVAKRHNEGIALGYVGVRTLEAAVIAVGVVPFLAARAGSDAPDLVAFHNGTFLVGPGLVVGVDTVLMAYLMYRSGLVPRIIPILGLIGGPLVFLSSTAQLFGAYPQYSTWAALPAVPVFAWEIGLALYMIIKGFRPVPLARLDQPSTVGAPGRAGWAG